MIYLSNMGGAEWWVLLPRWELCCRVQQVLVCLFVLVIINTWMDTSLFFREGRASTSNPSMQSPLQPYSLTILSSIPSPLSNPLFIPLTIPLSNLLSNSLLTHSPLPHPPPQATHLAHNLARCRPLPMHPSLIPPYNPFQATQIMPILLSEICCSPSRSSLPSAPLPFLGHSCCTYSCQILTAPNASLPHPLHLHFTFQATHHACSLARSRPLPLHPSLAPFNRPR